MNDLSLFIKGLEELEIKLSDEQINQFINYYDLLIEWNKVMNLTAITDFNEVINKHFLDSLLLKREINMSNNLSLIDVGTGAGFPGIPLKIAFPNIEVVLLDSLNKRISFLNEVIDELELKRIKTIHGRAEDYGRDPLYRENFDLCVSRAVSNLVSLSEYCIPFIKTGGKFISYKSESVDSELNDSKKAIELLGGQLIKKSVIRLPNTDIDRAFIIIEKTKSTPKRYPRKAGTPTKEPILNKEK